MDVFPSLVGLRWDRPKTPQFATIIQPAVSGREIRIAEQIYPLYTFELTYEVLRDDPTLASPSSPSDELKKLLGFFLKQQGSLQAFLYDDPADDACTDMPFATGNGSATAFQLTRAYGAGGFTFTEPVQNLNGTVTNIKDNGSVVNPANYSVSATGLVTFTSAPASGHGLTWTGAYYYRVRFLQDLQQFNQFMKNLWDAKKISFKGALGNKV